MKAISRIFTILPIALLLFSGCKEESVSDPELRFNSDGKFKIVQFTDIHLSLADPEDFEKVVGQCADAIKVESPDIVVFTGDAITGSEGTAELVERLLSIFDDNDIPFVLLFGNHDRERQLSDRDLAVAVSSHKNSLNTVTNHYLDDVAVSIKSSDGSRQAAVLYCMDSGDYAMYPGYGNYGWIAHSQIDWYIGKSHEFAAANGNVPVPSYAFFHIPLKEFEDAYESGILAGNRMERECYGTLNSGLFSAMVENGDVHGVFCGHDHNNDYVAKKGDVALVYGAFTGGKGSYHSETLEGGCRVIVLTEGEYGFHTWIRSNVSGERICDYQYDTAMDYSLKPAVSPSLKVLPGLKCTELAGDTTADCIDSCHVTGNYIIESSRIFKDITHPEAYVLEGLLYVPESGLWGIDSSSDGIYSVAIDDYVFKRINDRRVRNVLNLEKGYHKLRVEDFSEMHIWFYLQWRRPLEDRFHEIPSDYFFHEE